MDAFQLLEEVGNVPPADDATVEAAVDLIRTEAFQAAGPAPLGAPKSRRPRRRLLFAGAALAAGTAAALVAAFVLPTGGGAPSQSPGPSAGAHGHTAPAVLTASKVRLISSQSAAALADSGTATETTTNTVGSTTQGPPTTIDVTFSGQNVNYLITSNGNGAEGVQNRVVGGQLYLYIKGPDLQMHWYHEIEANAAASASFPDPRTLLAAVSPSAGLENLGRQAVDGVELTHLRATTPGSIGQLGIPDVSGTVTSFEVWVDSADVVRQMAVSSSDGTACEVVPNTAVGSSNTINVEAPNGTKERVGVSCGTSQTLGSTLEVRFTNVGVPETVTAPIGAIDQQGHG